MKPLGRQTWARIASSYAVDSAAVIDRVFEPQYARKLRQLLLEHWGWRYKNWVDKHLTNLDVGDISEISKIAEAFRSALPAVLSDKPFCQAWAIMQNQNAGLHPHADNGDVIINVWMTPNRFNIEPETGGLLILDVRRGKEQPFHEFASPPWCTEYFEAHTKGDVQAIKYAYNRAVLFDGLLFHMTDRIRFDASKPGGARLSLTFVFGDKAAARRRFDFSTHAESK